MLIDIKIFCFRRCRGGVEDGLEEDILPIFTVAFFG